MLGVMIAFGVFLVMGVNALVKKMKRVRHI